MNKSPVMHDPSAYDPYLDPSSYNLDQPQTAYTQEKHNGQYVEVIQQSDEHQGLHPKPATTMSSDAATFRTITWPDGPRFVKQSRVIHALTFFLDAILVLVALLFLVLAIMALRFAHEPAQSDLAVTIAQAMKLVRAAHFPAQANHTDFVCKGPTIYPVLFAALLGRALKGIGRWRAERGTRVTVSIGSTTPGDDDGPEQNTDEIGRIYGHCSTTRPCSMLSSASGI